MVQTLPPSDDLCESALRAAERHGRKRHAERTDLTRHAIMERVVGLLMPSLRGRDGWWLIGHLHDSIADREDRVWAHPEERRLGLSPVERPETVAPPTPESATYYDGLTRRWRDRATGAVVEGPER